MHAMPAVHAVALDYLLLAYAITLFAIFAGYIYLRRSSRPPPEAASGRFLDALDAPQLASRLLAGLAHHEGAPLSVLVRGIFRTTVTDKI